MICPQHIWEDPKVLYPEFAGMPTYYWTFAGESLVQPRMPLSIACQCGIGIAEKIQSVSGEYVSPKRLMVTVNLRFSRHEHLGQSVFVGIGQCPQCQRIYWTCDNITKMKRICDALQSESDEAKATMRAMAGMVRD